MDIACQYRGITSERIERLKAAYGAWNKGDRESFLAELHPDAEFHQAAGFPGMGLYRGPEAITAAFDDLVGAFADFKVEPEKLFDLDDGRVLVFVRLSGRGRGSDAPFTVDGAHLFTPAPDGRLLRFDAYFDRDEARQAAGLGD